MKKILVLIVLVMLSVVGWNYFRNSEKPGTDIVTATKIEASVKIGDEEYVKSELAEGSTALDQLNKVAVIETKGEGVNAYVTAINSRKADDSKKEFWSMYVNGKMATVGAGSYILKADDKIEWKIETF